MDELPVVNSNDDVEETERIGGSVVVDKCDVGSPPVAVVDWFKA